VVVYELLKLRNNILIENQINKGIPKKDLIVLNFPLNILKSDESIIKWKNVGKEFVYNKKSYDIVSKNIINDTIYFHCIHDTKEEQIILNYKAAIQKNMPNNTNHRKTNLFFPKVSIDYYCQAIDINSFNIFSIPMLYSYFHFYKSNSIELPSPPPKYLV
jgi:hypothetical protein